MARRVRHTYSPQMRAAILAAAERENLTANDVQKKFGVPRWLRGQINRSQARETAQTCRGTSAMRRVT